MSKLKVASIVILSVGIISVTPTLAASNYLNSAVNLPQVLTSTRLFGHTKFETAKVISEYYNHEKVKNVILATGNDFADALAASVLAHDKEAPILLVDSSVDNSKDAFEYVVNHLDLAGTVYIVGGTGIIGAEFEVKLKDLGFVNISRIAGLDRYQTSSILASLQEGRPVSTVVISSGNQYSDALSISSFAAKQGWPILLTPPEMLPADLKSFLLAKKPDKVYITGGTGIISDNVSSDIKALLPQTSVERLTGQSRFDTNIVIAEAFAPNPETIFLTNGDAYADAMAGSVVAAKNGDPIIFIDPTVPTLPKPVAQYFAKLYAANLTPNIISLGGNGAVSDEIVANSRALVEGLRQETSIYSIPDVTATVNQGEEYTLPATVQARLYNSEVINLPVQWDSQDVDTGRIGSTIYNGVIEGFGQVVKLNLMVQKPTVESVMSSGIIAQYSTHFDSAQLNRSENIRLAAKALDGKILAPGERFSFNKSVGERTVEAGYKEAIIIEGDAYAPGLGGGVCQVSSDLYNAVILAGLEVLERHRHSLAVDYVPYGQDATVAYPTLDFKFRNNTKSYLLIRSSVESNTLTFTLYGKQGKHVNPD